MSTTIEEKLTLKLQRTFAAPRERVFAAWTEPAQMREWFPCHVDTIEQDLRPGGNYRFTMTNEKGEKMAASGVYREVTPPARLVYTWRWEDDPDYSDRETLVTLEFLDRNGSTEIRLTHENFPTPENVANHEHGWSLGFDKLEKLLG